MSSDHASERTYRACLLGASLGTGNRGVSALCASFAKLVTDARANADIAVLIGNRDAAPYSLVVGGTSRQIRVVNYRLSPRALGRDHILWIAPMALLYRLLPWSGVRRRIRHHTPWINELEEADLVGEIRGGDSFSDIYGLKRFLVGSLGVLTVIWVRGGVALLPQTYGPFKSWPARAVARYVLHHASAILARDQEGLSAVQQLTNGRRPARFCPDIAFALESIVPARMEVRPSLATGSATPLIGLNVNGLVYHGGYTRANMFRMRLDYRAFLPRLIEVLLRAPEHRLLLVPHTFAPPQSVESDPGASEDVLRQLPSNLRERVHLVSREYDQNEIKGIIGLCDFFVGSRMHACVAALSQAKPAIGVAYSKKFVGVFDSVGMKDWVVDGRAVDTEEALRRVETLFARRHEVRPVLQARVKETQQRLAQVFSTLLTGPLR